MTKYEDLEVGYEFPAIGCELSPSMIAKYEEAVEAHSPVATSVPPSAIAAYAMKAISQSLSLPPGSIHASQEFEFFNLVAAGSHIDCQARVVQRISRAKLNMVVVELNAFDQNRRKVLSGKTTLILAN